MLSPRELIERKLRQAGELPDVSRQDMVCICGGDKNPGRIAKSCEVHGWMLSKEPLPMTPELLKIKAEFESHLDEVVR